MSIELSIIIPIYNVEKYLDRCLKSIEPQCDYRVEIICVDDGSTDSSVSICKGYKSKITNFKIVQQENSGVSVARNKGIEMASGEWIWFVDPDDWIGDCAIEELRKIEKQKCDIVVFSYYNVYKKGYIQNDFGFGERIIQADENSEDIMRLKEMLISPERVYIKGYFGAVWFSLFRREYLLKNNCLFDKALRKSQDTLFNLQVLDCNPRIKFVNQALYYYVHNNTSICYKYMPDAEDKLIPILEAINKYIAFQKGDFSEAFLERRRNTLYQILDLEIAHQDNKDSWMKKRKCWNEIKSNQWFRDCMSFYLFEKMSIKRKFRFLLVKMNCLMLISVYNNYKRKKIFNK